MNASGQLKGCQLADAQFLDSFRQAIASRRVPFTGTIELTHRCNLRCVHCFGGDQTRVRRAREIEISTDSWKKLLDEAAAGGCVDLLITGGEPMLRPDFVEIFHHAKELGMVVTVFTNATRVTEEILEVFFDLPPFLVEVSLYGATAETHERITQVKSSYRKTLRGIERLLAAGVRVGLKTVIMCVNAHEMGGLRKLADSYGVPLRMDPALFPCLPRGDSGGVPNRCGGVSCNATQPLDLRADAEEVIEIEWADEHQRTRLIETWQRWQGRLPSHTGLLTCGAGLTGFHLDPYGTLQPCLLLTAYRESAAELGFAEAWRRLGRVREVPAPPNMPCRTCEAFPLCSGCPGLFSLEEGDMARPPGYICAIAKGLYERVRAVMKDRPPL